MALDGLEALVGNDVLHAAGVRCGGLLRDAQMDEHFGQHGVALVDGLRQGTALLRQEQAAVFTHGDIVLLPENAHGPGDAGLGIAQIFAHVYAADEGRFLAQHQDGLQVHFTGFVYAHSWFLSCGKLLPLKQSALILS